MQDELYSNSSLYQELRGRLYPRVSDAEWCDWRWQMENRVTSCEELNAVLPPTAAERIALASAGLHPFSVTPHYLVVVAQEPALRASVIPQRSAHKSPRELDDPLGEEKNSVLPGLVQSYPDKVLFLVSGKCAVYCRYCTRGRLVGCKLSPEQRNHQSKISWLKKHSEIRDVLISGGDPLLLLDSELEQILHPLQDIPHLKVLRIGTKIPAAMPQRLTDELIERLSKNGPLWLSLHFSHPAELTPATVAACKRLADAGIPMVSQTVLLRGINDSVPVLKKLFYGLLEMRVKPYYLLQCDPVSGSEPFRVPVERGVELIRALHGRISGLAVPQYVIDAPGGGGKVPILSTSQYQREKDFIFFNNHEGERCRYPLV